MRLTRVGLSILAAAVLFSTTTLSAKEEKAKANIERGFRFGDLRKEKEEEKLKKASVQELLAKLVKLSKKQLKEQERIREILEEEYDPQPKEITLKDGTKCIANSSAKCFKMPMINEVKKIPAIAEAYKNPTLKNIKKREMWYGMYTLNVLKDSYLKGQAIRELGEKYPLATKPLGTINNFGYDSIVLDDYRESLVNKHMGKFELNVFLGLNKSLDMYSLIRLAYLIGNNPSWKFNLIFNSNASKKHWESQYKNFNASKNFEKANVFVQPSAFKEFKIYTTPSISLKDKKKGKDTLIFVGRATQGDIIARVIEYMIHHKYIERKDLTATKAWKSDSSEKTVETYFNRTIGIDYEK